jgi:hypothetical protein
MGRYGLFSATLDHVRRDELEGRLADGRAEEPPLFIRQLDAVLVGHDPLGEAEMEKNSAA